MIKLVCYLLCLAATVLLGVDQVGKVIHQPASDAHAEIRGMTVSCQTWGWEWGTDEMVETMQELKAIGVNWITIHPYAAIRNDGTVDSRFIRDGESADWLTRPIEEAHKLGLKIMIKPHLAHWGSQFSWRGAITFETDEEWQRFFETYHQWIVRTAAICRNADAFVVGTELDRTVHFEKRWRAIIADIRDELSGVPLTYSSNWDVYQRVPFWDALDVISIQAYFPMINEPRLPTVDELNAGWDRVLAELAAFSARHNRKIVFGELGYNRSSLAAYQPWESQSGGEQAEEIQRRCLTVALDRVTRSDVVAGAFLWKWFPDTHRRRGNFLKSTPSMQAVIKSAWLAAE